jgi:hypothetical protein
VARLVRAAERAEKSSKAAVEAADDAAAACKEFAAIKGKSKGKPVDSESATRRGAKGKGK